MSSAPASRPGRSGEHPADKNLPPTSIIYSPVTAHLAASTCVPFTQLVRERIGQRSAGLAVWSLPGASTMALSELFGGFSEGTETASGSGIAGVVAAVLLVSSYLQYRRWRIRSPGGLRPRMLGSL